MGLINVNQYKEVIKEVISMIEVMAEDLSMDGDHEGAKALVSELKLFRKVQEEISEVPNVDVMANYVYHELLKVVPTLKEIDLKTYVGILTGRKHHAKEKLELEIVKLNRINASLWDYSEKFNKVKKGK